MSQWSNKPFSMCDGNAGGMPHGILCRFRRRAILAPVGAGLLLSGCSSGPPWMNDAQNVLDPNGPTSAASNDYKVPDLSAAAQDPAGMFEQAWKKAVKDQFLTINPADGNKNPESPLSADYYSADFEQMARLGSTVEWMNCDAFFASRGVDQKWLLTFKDVATAVGSAATGVLALASPSNATAAGAVALATGSAYNAVDIYSRNFLFGADNIDNVLIMTRKALQAHEDAAFPPKEDASPWTFEHAVQYLADHQAICGPAHIRSLALAAISKGTLVAVDPSGTAFTSNASQPASTGDAATAEAKKKTSAAAAAGSKVAPSIAPATANMAADKAVTAAVQAALSEQSNGGDRNTASDAAHKAAMDAALKTAKEEAPGVDPVKQKAFAQAVAGKIAPAAVDGAFEQSTAPRVTPRATRSHYYPANHNATVVVQ